MKATIFVLVAIMAVVVMIVSGHFITMGMLRGELEAAKKASGSGRRTPTEVSPENRGKPATARQISRLQALGVSVPDGLTRQQAHEKISSELALAKAEADREQEEMPAF